ncbi:MAG: hypothetical protein HYY32_03730 [Chloroflexi bacterium]|nr:hypothetical protein [Chloroflexota bacterium]
MQRRYTGLTPLGLTFSKVAGLTTGGVQNHGFYACALKTIQAPKFLKADGGWDRIVWMAKTLKEQLAGFIPEEIYSRIATEEDAIEPKDLKEHLKKIKHPIVTKFWKDGEPVPMKIPLTGEMWPGDEDYVPL